MKSAFFLFLFFIFSLGRLFAQLLPPNQPEQDACHAVQLCGHKFFTPYSYQNVGVKLDMPSTPCGSGETNSVWFKIVINTPGNIVFSIIPVDSTDDYDFAIIELTGKSCDKLSPTDVIRCNFNNNQQPNHYYSGGIVGLNTTSLLSAVSSGAYGNPFLKQITADPGAVYLIMINNFGGSGGPSSGFTLDFTGSTATFVNNGLPEYDSLSLSCGPVKDIKVHMNIPVLCSSIATDGSDFQIVPNLATVTSAAGLNCTGSNGYTQDISLTLSNPVPAGTYILKPKTGSDGNTIIDLCEQEQSLQDSILLNVFNPVVYLGADTTTCINNTVQLHAAIEGGASGNRIQWIPATYLNDPSVADPISSPLHDITYTVIVTPISRPECATRDSIHIDVLQGFDLLTKDTTICIGTSLPLNTSGDNRYHYQWTPAEGIANPQSGNTTVTPDTSTTYTITASYPGCRDSSKSVMVDVEYIPALVDFDKDQDSICRGKAILFTPHIDGKFLNLFWDFGDGTSSFTTDTEPIRHAYEKDGYMTVKLHAGFHACPEIAVQDSVTVFPYPTVHFTSDTSLCLDGSPITLFNTAVNPPGTYHYLWNTGAESQTLTTADPGIYRLTMTSARGCATTEEIEIKNGCYLNIPNAFFPNSNRSNGYFFPRQLLSKNVTAFKMQIFNRWGQLVFETENLNGRGWDGRLNGKPQPEGVYVYIIEATIDGSREERHEGNVTLLR